MINLILLIMKRNMEEGYEKKNGTDILYLVFYGSDDVRDILFFRTKR